MGVGLAETGFSGPEFVSILGEWAGGLFSGLIAAFGNIALVFAIIERTQAAKEFEKEFLNLLRLQNKAVLDNFRAGKFEDADVATIKKVATELAGKY